jgi:hypothetical protein
MATDNIDGETRVSSSVIPIAWRYLLTQPKMNLKRYTTDLPLSSHRTHGPAGQKARVDICRWLANPPYLLCGLVRKRTIPTERPPLVGEGGANFYGYRVSRAHILQRRLLQINRFFIM